MSSNLPSLSTLLEVPTASTSQKAGTSSQQDIVDFFSAIEKEHPTTLNPQISKTGYVQRGSNPFVQLANGQPQIALQSTGFIVPQQTVVPHQPNAFGNFQSQQQSTHWPFSSYLMSQPTGFQQLQQPQSSWFLQSSQQQTFLQPQPTGRNNPFRQSMLVPQSTGMALFGVRHGHSTPNGQSSQGALTFLPYPSSTMPLPVPTPSMEASSNNTPTRPSSAPLASYNAPSLPLQPVKSLQIGTKNPFAPFTITPPPAPKAPTLLELTTGMAANGDASQSRQSAEQPLLQQQSALDPEKADISSAASSFTLNPNAAVGSTIGDKSSSNNSGFMDSQQTGTTVAGLASSDSRSLQSIISPTMLGPPSVTSHAEGFGDLKPFIPSSSFGTSLKKFLFRGSSPNAVGSPINDKSSSNNSGFMGFQQTGTTVTGFAFPDSRLPQSNMSPTMPGPPPVTSYDTGINPFIPSSSSFGASFKESVSFLGSSPTNPTSSNAVNRLATSPGAANQISSSSSNDTGNYSVLNNRDTAATGGFGGASSTYELSLSVVGLRPQMTGEETVNPLQAPSPLDANSLGTNGTLDLPKVGDVVELPILDRGPPDGENIVVSNAQLENIPDPEVVVSTEVSEADIQTHRVALGKQKEEISDEFFETQTPEGSVFDWEDILRTQLQEEEELLALSDGHLSQEGEWFLSLRKLLTAEEDEFNNAVASSSLASYTQNSNRGFTTVELPTNEFPEETHECGVCNDLFCVALSVQLPTCKHSFCRECLSTFTKVKIDEGRYPILCPVCAIERSKVNNSHITQEIVEQLELSWRDLQKLYALQLVEHSVVWDCPRCKQTMNVDREEYASQLIITCPLPSCGHPWCKECLKSLASGDTEHDCKQQEFDLLMQKKGWKYCPGCKTPVQKETGCNHMTCGSPGCNVHFCYKCGSLIINTSNGGDVGSAVKEHFDNCVMFDK